ncbi:SIMPL domain-containing protein [Boseongicola aestuarii]|uniref:26 kDa periplasmic immunogenic protein n=1 Tax=Boseongicola aestuarii TaxID=1470561 RepID=A0A238IX52_9RHOB|nr:SIMPL domain-containing protein [Boseongicola aestuarii]SMX22562.1 26 kDa periplasmic immunogenic protein precursor [Boseongicola aestuarii]
MRFLGLVLIAAVGLWPQFAMADDSERRIVVSGEGVVSAEPDMATVFVGVSREARLADAALQSASEAAATVLARLEAEGIESRDIQTRGIGLSPQYARSNDGSAPRVTGYVASNDLMVRVRSFDRLGAVLNAIVADGANMMNGLSFDVAERGELEQAARRQAVEIAREKAEVLAGAAGVTLGSVLTISEGGAGPAPFAADVGMMMEARSAVPVAGGEIDVRASVTMVFSIAD